MDKEWNELMQISIIGENEFLSSMVEDIVPICANKMECNAVNMGQKKTTESAVYKNQEFRIVVYKKENPLIKFFKSAAFIFKKMRIFGSSREINLARSNK